MSLFQVKEEQESVTLAEDHLKLGHDESEVTENNGNREHEISEKPAFEIRRKRPRSEDDDDGRREVDDENDGFKTPTRPENVIPGIRQCPAAPRKPRLQESSVLTGIKTASCRRRLEFSAEEIDSFMTDLQRRSTTTKKKRII